MKPLIKSNKEPKPREKIYLEEEPWASSKWEVYLTLAIILSVIFGVGYLGLLYIDSSYQACLNLPDFDKAACDRIYK